MIHLDVGSLWLVGCFTPISLTNPHADHWQDAGIALRKSLVG